MYYCVSDSSELEKSSLTINISPNGSLSRDIFGSLAFLLTTFMATGSKLSGVGVS